MNGATAAASRTEVSGSYSPPLSFSSKEAADPWTLDLALGRSKAGAVKSSTATVTLSKKMNL